MVGCWLLQPSFMGSCRFCHMLEIGPEGSTSDLEARSRHLVSTDCAEV